MDRKELRKEIESFFINKTNIVFEDSLLHSLYSLYENFGLEELKEGIIIFSKKDISRFETYQDISNFIYGILKNRSNSIKMIEIVE